ncbi:hypothetical protein H6F88_13320 [Oculatella sp. FACHB-28]|uniref:hypothetical protein n=1 Tax=Cyanophyceae TaxID=3028117 RepID=UPI001687A2B3|nr:MULTISPECIES: hypothetical protein [Cyanophyceae]MBD2056982.1 hypothetical protein [Oculatella sp. FACHB-28]MBD2067961.1 hypothetical protein [Leptolyngbya sp. FACHB-671]
MTHKTSFQQAIDAVEALSIEDQEMLLDVLHKRLASHRQKVLVQEVSEVRQEYAQGNVQFGTVTDFLAELDD